MHEAEKPVTLNEVASLFRTAPEAVAAAKRAAMMALVCMISR